VFPLAKFAFEAHALGDLKREAHLDAIGFEPLI
jgi:hypothetical protein